MRWTAEQLATAAGGRLVRRGQRTIAGAFIDSRTPVVDGLFVPVVAARDGHDFIPAAVAGGAAAVLQAPGRALPGGECTVVEVDDTLAALGRLAAAARAGIRGPVVSVTGSNGKTTTRAMIAAVLATRHAAVLATRGNFNNHLGVPLTLLGEPHAADAAVIEMGMSAPGENDRLGAIVRPDVAVITGVAIEHLEFMGSLEAIAAAEAEVVPHLRAGGVVVVPDDEPLLTPHVEGVARATFGAGTAAAVQIVGVEQDERTHVTLRLYAGAAWEEVRLSLALFGAHNARNAAAALAVGLRLGCPVPAMLAALEAVQPVGDRGRVARFGPHLLIADCYNANPGSMTAALTALAALKGRWSGPLVAVLGDMLELGPDAPALHAEVGALAARLGLDAVFTYGPLAEHTAIAAKRGGIAAWHAGESIEDLIAAVRARFGARPGAVLLKGSRGMRLERVVAALVEAPA
ncbi:MAG: UDP-N-acetylmuramoyl-tripeptide--D-alanyl-D-alanine ligase [Myxococcales bacterium]|nr:UDP-N-acetylmuramoyl-tripeptide--D-alanyl-D-alanine ligase [Myxococcales bacterium]